MSSPLSTPEPWQAVAPAYAADVAPMFVHYAARALELAALPPGAEVLDVACGPGTLAFLAAEQGAQVQAIDFAPAMIEALKARLRTTPAAIEAQVGDGMYLPYGSASFDAAFSMFGLMFFPERARGFAELFRVLRPGGVAVISSWQPMDRAPLLAAPFAALAPFLPPSPPRSMPLTQVVDHQMELGAAGFEAIEVVSVLHAFEAPSTEALWQGYQRNNAVIVAVREHMAPEVWAQASEAVQAHLVATFGPGPQRVEMPAWIACGRKPA